MHTPSRHTSTDSDAFSFCPKCGAGLERRRFKHFEPERLVCAACEFVLFLDPKVAAGCIVERPDGIVLLRRSIEPGYGKWVFPGGYVDRGETVEEAAERETMEESRLQVQVASLVGVYSYVGRPIVVIVYTGVVTGGQLEAADEALEAATFAPADVPWDDLAFTSTFDALADYAARVHDLRPPVGATPPGRV